MTISAFGVEHGYGEVSKKDPYDAGRQRRFITNMAMGGAGGAAAGNIGAKIATRGRSKLRPGRAGLAGGALMGGVGVGIVSRERHRGKIHKAERAPGDPRDHDRRMRNTMAGIGATGSTMAAGTAGIGYAERRGHDPFGFTHPGKFTASGSGAKATWKPLSGGAKKKILSTASRAHGKQALAAGAVGAAGLGAAGMYQHKLKKHPVSKMSERTKSNLTDAATGTASAGAVGVGGSSAHMLGSHTRHHLHFLPQDQKDLARMKGMKRPNAAKMAHLQQQVKFSRRVVGVKGTGAVASAGLATAGGYGLYRSGKHALQTNRKQG